jgi:hypothetical protein
MFILGAVSYYVVPTYHASFIFISQIPSSREFSALTMPLYVSFLMDQAKPDRSFGLS